MSDQRDVTALLLDRFIGREDSPATEWNEMSEETRWIGKPWRRIELLTQRHFWRGEPTETRGAALLWTVAVDVACWFVIVALVAGSFKRAPWGSALKEAVAALDRIAEALGAWRLSVPERNAATLWWHIHRKLGSGVRWDVFWHELGAGRVRMALTVLFLPKGYSVTYHAPDKSEQEVAGA